MDLPIDSLAVMDNVITNALSANNLRAVVMEEQGEAAPEKLLAKNLDSAITNALSASNLRAVVMEEQGEVTAMDEG